MYKYYNVKKNQRTVLLKNEEIVRVLGKGSHFFWDPLNRLTAVCQSLEDTQISHQLAEEMLRFHPELVEQHCISAVLKNEQLGLRYQDDELVEVLASGTKSLFWKNQNQQRIDIVDLVGGYQLTSERAEHILLSHRVKKVKGIEHVLLRQIAKSEIGVLHCNGEVCALLEPGVYGYSQNKYAVTVESYQLAQALVEPKLAEYLRCFLPEWVERYCTEMELGADEAGLRYEDGLLVEIVAPGNRRLYWKGLAEQRFERVALEHDYKVPDAIVSQLLQPKLRHKAIGGAEGVLLVQVPAYHTGILKVDGEIRSLLEPGATGYWRFNRDVHAELVDTRLQALEVSGQEILTRDKVNLRINLAANWRYSDVLTAYKLLAKPAEHLYRELQFGLREAVGTRTLDELLENKQVIDQVVSAYLAEKMADTGIETVSLGVKDIVLPGDMKTILSQVVEAEKAAQANVIRRREETAATRSLLNTAKVMENNPVALRLKEMETLERVAERIDKISVFGGLDQVLNGLVQIKAP